MSELIEKSFKAIDSLAALNQKPLTPAQAELMWRTIEPRGFEFITLAQIGRWLYDIGGYEVPIVEL